MAELIKEQENKEQEQLIAQFLGGNDEEEFPTYDEIPIPVSYEGLVNEDIEGLIPYDVDKFKKGVKDYSYIAGAFSALRNSGMSEENAMKWLLAEVEVKCMDKQLTSQETIIKIQADAHMKEEL